MLHHVYGIADRLSAACRLPEAGVDDHPVIARRLGDLVVLSSLIPMPVRLGPRTQSRHHDVLAEVSGTRAVFPVRCGVTVASRDLPAWLAVRAGAVRAGLRVVRGRVEMRVSLLALHVGDGDSRRLREVAARVTAAVGFEHSRSHVAGTPGNAAMALAFLIPRADVATFLARIANTVTRAGDVAVVPSGPWPPYAFVPTLDAPGPSPSLAVPALSLV